MFGRVTKFFHDRGYYVFFKPYADDRSDYNAKNVNVIEVPEKRKFKR